MIDLRKDMRELVTKWENSQRRQLIIRKSLFNTLFGEFYAK